MATLEEGSIREILHRAWWSILLRGILAVILGLVAFFQPAFMLLGIVQVLGLFFLLDGVLLIISAVTGHAGGARWLALLGGIFYVLAGIAIFSSPLLSALLTQVVVIYMMAFFVMIAGIMRIVTAMRLWRTSDHKWLLIVEGMIGIIFAVILMESPIVSAEVLMRIVGAIAVVLAIIMIMLAISLRKLARAA